MIHHTNSPKLRFSANYGTSTAECAVEPTTPQSISDSHQSPQQLLPHHQAQQQPATTPPSVQTPPATPRLNHRFRRWPHQVHRLLLYHFNPDEMLQQMKTTFEASYNLRENSRSSISPQSHHNLSTISPQSHHNLTTIHPSQPLSHSLIQPLSQATQSLSHSATQPLSHSATQSLCHSVTEPLSHSATP